MLGLALLGASAGAFAAIFGIPRLLVCFGSARVTTWSSFALCAVLTLPALARKWIFGTDWPGVPGVARNARAIVALGLSADILSGVLSGNAARVYLRG